jgi:uncharacterized protein (DUF302 family)
MSSTGITHWTPRETGRTTMPNKGDVADTAGIITKSTTGGSVTDTVSALIEAVQEHGMTVFATIDHSGEAHKHGLTLRDTAVVIFGSPIRS